MDAVTKQIKELEPGAVILLPSKKPAMFMGAEYPRESKDKIYSFIREWVNGHWVMLAEAPTAPTVQYTLAPEKMANEFLAEIKKASARILAIPKISLTSGTDPEIFVLDSKGDVIPAWEFLPTKTEAMSNALPQVPIGNEAMIPCFWDGYQAEICPNGKICLETLHDQIRLGLQTVQYHARKFDPKAKLSIQNTVELSQTLVEDATDDQIRFRCTPSYNVYREHDDPTPDPRKYRFRFAGGHLHIGLPRRVTAPIYAEIVRALDGVLGVAGVSLAAGIDSPERRKMYGKCGEFRLPKHGIEYRVLSNFWLSHPAISHLVFELMRLTVQFAISGLYRTCWETEQAKTREIVNTNDIEGARAIIKANKHIYGALLNSIWGNSPVTSMALRTIENGIGVVISDPLDIENNWDLTEGKTWKPYGRHQGGSWASQAMLKSSAAPRVAVLNMI